MSDLTAPLPEAISARVDELQTREKEVAEIASSGGYGRLLEDDPHVLGQWVHSVTHMLSPLQQEVIQPTQ